MATQPTATDIGLVREAAPAELRTRRQWVGWRFQDRNGEPTKVPYDPFTGNRADTTDPSTWSDFEQAMFYFENSDADGVGYVFSPDDEYCGIDLDKCRDPQTGQIEDWANEIIDSMNSYAEVSPSRTGVKIFVKATKHGSRCRTGNIEIYDRDRYFTVTGNRFTSSPESIQPRQTELDALYHMVFEEDNAPSDSTADTSEQPRFVNPHAPPSDEAVLNVLQLSSSAAKFHLLWTGHWQEETLNYPSQNEADLALVSYLVFVCGGDDERIDRIFRQSGLYREKWDRPDYRRRTIDKALRDRTEFYVPTRSRASSSPPPKRPAPPPPPPVKPSDSLPKPAVTATPPAPSPVVAGRDPVACVRDGEPYHQTDLGNAERFAAFCGTDVRHAHGIGWLVWDGCRWCEDDLHAVLHRATLCARNIYKEAAASADMSASHPDLAVRARNAGVSKGLLQWANRSESRERLNAMIEVAKAQRCIAIRVSDLDADPWLLNCRNGIVDLRTATLRPHRREDLITKLAPVESAADADCPQWRAFLNRIFDANGELIAFAQRSLGYALTGVVHQHVLQVLFGAGANGKSTFLETISTMLGDYASHAAPGLLVKRRSDSHPTELADLRGARMVSCIETAEGGAFDEERVKALTGGDRIKARKMRQDFFEFSPTHKLFLATNHRPIVRGDDNGIWRRLRLWPFTVEIPKDEQDLELKDKLLGELSGILAWCVEGCLMWQRDGLGEPGEVVSATQDYRDQQDHFGAWIDECCELPGDHDDPTTFHQTGGELYRSYRLHCDQQGIMPLGNWKFSERLKGIAGVTRADGRNRTYYGIKLTAGAYSAVLDRNQRRP